MNRDKVLQMIGLAMKAGKVKSGEFLTETEVKTGGACLVVIAGDASAATKKKFRNMCEYYHVPVCCYGDKDTLGHAIGREFRASLAVTDAGFAREIRKRLDTTEDTVA